MNAVTKEIENKIQRIKIIQLGRSSAKDNCLSRFIIIVGYN